MKVNLYQEDHRTRTAPRRLKLVDTTTSTSWDDWAQGFRRNPDGTLVTVGDGTGTRYVPNMNCPGQETNSPFYFTMKNGTLPAEPDDTPLADDGRFKCYDGWSMLNQVQPAPYNGMYKFPSVVAKASATGGAPGCADAPPTTGPAARPDDLQDQLHDLHDQIRDDGTPMLPPGKYVVEVVVPPGYELVKEEDKNILLGDAYIAPR